MPGATGSSFDRAGLLAAFDEIGRAARAAGTRLELAARGGAALMLASGFRFATEDVAVADLETPRPAWLAATVEGIAHRNGWPEERLDDAATFHLSPLVDTAADRIAFGSLPRDGAAGLDVLVSTAHCLLALELKAMGITDPFKGPQEGSDIRSLMRAVGVDREGATDILGRLFRAARRTGRSSASS